MKIEYEMENIPKDITKKMDEQKVQLIGFVTLLIKHLIVEDYESCIVVKKQLEQWKLNAGQKMNELTGLKSEFFIQEYTNTEKRLLNKMMNEHCSFIVD